MSTKYTTDTFMKLECDSCLCAMYGWESEIADLPAGPTGRPSCSRCGGTMDLRRFGNGLRPVNEHTEGEQ